VLHNEIDKLTALIKRAEEVLIKPENMTVEPVWVKTPVGYWGKVKFNKKWRWCWADPFIPEKDTDQEKAICADDFRPLTECPTKVRTFAHLHFMDLIGAIREHQQRTEAEVKDTLKTLESVLDMNT
jgi:hypothetical protein